VNLTKHDVEAVAKSRVSRAFSKTTNNWTVALVIGVIIGLGVAFKWSAIGGYVIWIAAVGLWFYYYSGLSKKQNEEKLRLVKEWEKEQRGVKDGTPKV
jgi:predicted MFS family arabinose efflux permease